MPLSKIIKLKKAIAYSSLNVFFSKYRKFVTFVKLKILKTH